jgi:hypothetical protein
MSDLVMSFEEIPLLGFKSGVTAYVDGAADIVMGDNPSRWDVVRIRLNLWDKKARKGSFVTLSADDENPEPFFQVANAIIIDLALGEAIERELMARYGGKVSVYDRARAKRAA